MFFIFDTNETHYDIGQHINTEAWTKQSPPPSLWKEKGDCCGCSACFSICPQDAITMKADNEGFLYPVIDLQICIGCSMCKNVCAFKKEIKNRRVDNEKR